MKKVKTLIYLLIILFVNLHAQINYMEDSIHINDSIRIEMHWSSNPPQIGQIVVYDPCPGNWAIRSPIDSFGHATLKIKGVLPGSYEILYRIALDPNQIADLSYYVYYNEVLKDEGSYRLTGPGYGLTAEYFSHISTPYANDFDVQGENVPLCFSFNRSVGMSAGNSCNSKGSWICEGQTVSYEIVTETDYVSFYDGDNEIGSFYSAAYPQGSSIGIRQKKLCTDTVDRYADISITWGNITKQTRVLINRLAPAVNFYMNDDYIRSGDTTWGMLSLDNPEAYRLRSIAPGICNYNVSANATYKVEILTGGQYINLIDPAQDGEYKTINALAQQDGNAEFQIIADGTATLQPATATIRVSSSDANIKDSIRTLVINPPLIRAIVDPPMIGAGDTATITIQQLNANGEYVDFPDDQQYEVGMMEGCVWGDILAKPSGGEFAKNNYFASVVKPIMFVAADSLEDDGGTVKLDIGIVETLNEKVKHKTIDTSWQRIKTELDKFYAAKRKGTKTAKKITQGETCPLVAMASPKYIPVKIETLDNIKILYPDSTSQYDSISHVPQMPTVTCRAKLNKQFNGYATFQWRYWVGSTILRKYLSGRNICARVANTCFKETKRIADFHSDNEMQWVVPFKLANLDTSIVKAPTRDDCSAADIVLGDVGNQTPYFTGGYVYVKVVMRDANYKIIGIGQAKGNKILGNNPDTSEIFTYINSGEKRLEMRAIVSYENRNATIEQFEWFKVKWPYGERGWPKYGRPNGFGIGQLDSHPSEQSIWNWKINIDTAIAVFKRKIDYARGHLSRKGNYTQQQLLKESFQLYNGGYLFKWNNKNNTWQLNPEAKDKYTHKYYGEEVYKIFKSLGGN